MGDYLTLNIEYKVSDGKFSIDGDVKEERRSDLIAEFLRTQMGADAGEGKADKRKAIERDIYHISLKWYPENDRFEASSDTGNLGLRDGILYNIVGKL